ncbi:hypothetical protein RRG08_054264 [Elysia crispata]|uniref:Uncharacterized protein n=1 Tax=Elysia crispata TaxID=231223 RepID=A0AAE0YBX2_9GAST|nr:hypothetical protein RRG08_054264 [Elysia crispata]
MGSGEARSSLDTSSGVWHRPGQAYSSLPGILLESLGSGIHYSRLYRTLLALSGVNGLVGKADNQGKRWESLKQTEELWFLYITVPHMA